MYDAPLEGAQVEDLNPDDLDAGIGESGSIEEETRRIFELYKNKRYDWEHQAREDQEYRLGRQWTVEQEKILNSRGQAAIVVNRIHPAVETAKALLTSNRPSFKVSPREDSDTKVANVLNQLLTYMYDISDGRSQVRQAVDDYYVTGLGYLLAYQNGQADAGKGEVMFRAVDPMDVYVDPNSRDRMFDDAENIIVSRIFTKSQAKKLYPLYADAIQSASGGEFTTDAIVTGRTDSVGIKFPGDENTLEGNDEYVRGYERYYKVREVAYRVHEKYSGKELRLTEKEYEEYLSIEVGTVNGQVFEGEQKIEQAKIQQGQQRDSILKQAADQIDGQIEKAAEELEIQYMEKEKELSESVELGEMIPERMETELAKMREGIDKQVKDAYAQALESAGQVEKIPDVEMKVKAGLMQEGLIEIVPVAVTKIKMCVVIGETHVFSRILPSSKYPIVPLCNLHTRTPYPLSDVRMVKGLQDYINKTRSLIIAHATTSTNMKVMIPAGSVDMAEFEQKWAQPGVGIEVDFDMGQPVVASPVPLPNELYQNEQSAKSDIDHQLGLYEMMMGNPNAAPQTYKATISLDEFGQRKIKSKLADIESGLTRLAQVAVPLMQELFQMEKVFRVVQANNSLSEYAINKKLYDDKTNEIKIFNDVTVGSYDVVYVSGSTLPSNRYAELEFYMEAYKSGLIDKQEVLKKTEVFDMEGVLERTDIIGQLQQQLEAATEQLKDLKGDMQTLTRENVHLKQKVEVEKFKTGLDKVETKAKAAGSLFDSRLGDQLSLVEKEVRDAAKDQSTPPSASNGAAKRR
tara:strand:- start:3262 stop:5664 length:2403 start_codon:yes stop_codon:yes gene_type:complete